MFQLSRKSSDPSTLLILFQLLGETQSVRAHAGVVCSIIHHVAGKKKKLSSICHFPPERGGSSAQSLRSQIRTVAILLLYETNTLKLTGRRNPSLILIRKSVDALNFCGFVLFITDQLWSCSLRNSNAHQKTQELSFITNECYQVSIRKKCDMWLHRFKFKKKLVYSHPKLVSFAPFFFIFYF